jgi:glutamate formiminotransferase
MALLAIPNVSEGRDRSLIEALAIAAGSGGARVLDVHTDAVHNRSVYTMTGTPEQLKIGLTALARLASSEIDLTMHEGVHPRVGGLDVCPFVPHESSMEEAVAAARDTAARIAAETNLPVYLYGDAVLRGPVDLPDLRRGGLEGVIERSASGWRPDFGPRVIDPKRGIVCVGARDVLIAFNIWVRGGLDEVRAVARTIRGHGGVRALGLPIDRGVSQISMNLTRPDDVGIDDVFAEVERVLGSGGPEIIGTEIVGLVPERYLPEKNAKAARLLMAPGRSLESVLAR